MLDTPLRMGCLSRHNNITNAWRTTTEPSGYVVSDAEDPRRTRGDRFCTIQQASPLSRMPPADLIRHNRSAEVQADRKHLPGHVRFVAKWSGCFSQTLITAASRSCEGEPSLGRHRSAGWCGVNARSRGNAASQKIHRKSMGVRPTRAFRVRQLPEGEEGAACPRPRFIAAP